MTADELRALAKRVFCFLFHWRCIDTWISAPYHYGFRCRKCGLEWERFDP